MKSAVFQSFVGILMIVLAGCATPTTRIPSSRRPSASGEAPGVKPSLKAGDLQAGSPTAGDSSTHSPGLPEGEFAILVESVPSGGMVVVNGIPVGKAPQRIVLPGTMRGFFRDQVSLKVRFIAEDAGHSSQTVEELLTPLDRIPAIVRFTSSGASRVAR
jgi:hypothetical protein